eukprot:CAMPEP_0114990032 /NCGR_PEP_ID=MMETSP0216-20121206/10544_1 /TAXON_ID=223996 /ORGANISM="Protocruzia adherens, Strain Boccale" /LENGTH=157 /DNA_ID=CAMNT_0002353109 /DNA_START=57 /DNA_END=530 /DNA_ORIENTATION=+
MNYPRASSFLDATLMPDLNRAMNDLVLYLVQSDELGAWIEEHKKRIREQEKLERKKQRDLLRQEQGSNYESNASSEEEDDVEDQQEDEDDDITIKTDETEEEEDSQDEDVTEEDVFDPLLFLADELKKMSRLRKGGAENAADEEVDNVIRKVSAIEE